MPKILLKQKFWDIKIPQDGFLCIVIWNNNLAIVHRTALSWTIKEIR